MNRTCMQHPSLEIPFQNARFSHILPVCRRAAGVNRITAKGSIFDKAKLVGDSISRNLVGLIARATGFDHYISIFMV